MTFSQKLLDLAEWIEVLTRKVRIVLLILETMHFFNLFLFAKFRKKSPIPWEKPKTREEAISLFRDAVSGSKNSFSSDLKRDLPFLFWLFDQPVYKRKNRTFRRQGIESHIPTFETFFVANFSFVRNPTLSVIDLFKK
ncbi:hypothetical protein LEP1GSC055_0266 [Leptospira borgpetersenii str. Brem 307]|uniref:Uncharacterized protein n=1 Tax=Leptospira borgpetersenii str. Brem 328 TaxID=1049780 RepID=A0ABC9SKH2_LEPBO|nr:hypothetical protein LEP1GSC055_0266 [Leptospira borgpetersenii str. Brem 307]EMN18320.1 hypothetical protein LEP1GSC056_0635 [Leptospira borgpetersenii str. Brem 328]